MRVGPAGPASTVRVTGRLRVCAPTGRLVIRVREQKTGFDDPPTLVAERFRRFDFRQHRHCETHAVRWTLGDDFIGVGVYRLRFQAVDKAGAVSRSTFRKFGTRD